MKHLVAFEEEEKEKYLLHQLLLQELEMALYSLNSRLQLQREEYVGLDE